MLAIVTLLAASGAAVAQGDAGVPATVRLASHATEPAAGANQWSRWQPKPRSTASRHVALAKRGRLVLRLRASAPAGTKAWYRLVLPRDKDATRIAFRASFRGSGAKIYLAAGSPARKLWTRSARAGGTRVTTRKSFGARRALYFGITRTSARERARRTASSLIVHSYSLSATKPGRSADPGLPGQATPPRPLGPRILWGARVGGSVYGAGFGDAPWDPRTLNMFESHAGKGVSILSWGQAWYHKGVPQPFYAGNFEAARAHGAIPMLDWSPWDRGIAGYDAERFQLADIIRGDHDAYIRQWAQGAAAWGKPFYLRPFHEMNGFWWPWSERKNGNSPGQLVAAWRHIHDIFTSVGATNATWVWAPNEINDEYTSIPLPDLYPGGAYVDWVGISGYNFGGPRWRSFDQAFGRTYRQLRALAPAKPVMLAEVGSAEAGGDKAAWIRDVFQVQLPTRYPAVEAVIWWNDNSYGVPIQIESSPSSQAAFATAIASPYYAGNEFSQLAASPIPPV